MNQLAMAIQNLIAGGEDLDCLNLTSSELIALKSIGNVIELSPTDMEAYLHKKGEPTEWLRNPLLHISPRAAD